MKKVWTIAALTLAVCLVGSSAWAQLVGGTTYPINGTENPTTSFQSIQTAVNYLVANGVTGTGQVILELSSGYAGEPGPVNIRNIPGTSATLGVTFRPTAGYTATTSIVGGATPLQFAFRLNGTNYITFDGQAGGVGGTRDWTISCTGGTNGQSAIRFFDSTGTGNTTNNVIRYCILRAEATGTTSAIVAKTTGTAGNLFQNNIIEYNLIESGATIRGYAVSLGWSVSGQANTGNIIRYNHIRKFTTNGIRFTGTFPNTRIYGNEIYFPSAIATATAVYGIYFSSTTSNSGGGVYIYDNKIYDILTTTAATTIYGFQQWSGSFTGDPVRFYNNFIALGNGATNNAIIYGIDDNTVSAGAPDYYYYNSVYIGGSVTTGAINSAAFRKNAGNPLLRMQDNVFFNARSNAGGTGTHWAISFNDSTTMGTIGYNDYFANGTGGVLGTVTGATGGNKTTLAAWKTAVPADQGSVSQDPNYLNATASPPDLHINTTIATQLESGGTPVAGITTDLDGDARNATFPDISADEFAGIILDLNGPGISYTALTNTFITTSPRTFDNVAITDASGVNTTAGTRPRCYYKKTSNANALNDNTNATDGWKYVEADGAGNTPFTFFIDYTLLLGGAGVAVNDTIQYFVTAEDLVGTPNVSINSGSFAAAPASCALTGAAFPIGGSIRNYVITQPPMNGDYTVGLTKFNQASGRGVSVKILTCKVTKTIEYLAGQAAELDKNGQPIEQPKQQTVTVDEPYQVLMENGKPYNGPRMAASKDGSKGVYLTLTAAIADLNTRGIDGATRLLLNDAAFNEAGAMTIDITNSYTPTATNTVTIQPNTGVSATVSVNSTSPVFIIAEPYVTIDGAANGGSGTSRDLTLVNNGAGASSGITFASGASNVTVKNVIGYTSATTVGYGLIWSTRSFNGLAQNNQVYRTVIGIQAQSGSNNFTATGNLIGSTVALDKIQNSGMVALDCTTFVFTGNTISGVSRPSTSSCAGIVIGNAAQNGTIVDNAITNVKHTGVGAAAYAAYGLRLSSSVVAANVAAYNNYIADILGDGDAGTPYTPHGILISLGGGYNVYYNSVNMFGNINVAAAAPITSAIQIASGVINLDIRDNNFVNRQTCTNAGGKCYGIYSGAANTAYTLIDNNDYFVAGANGVLGYLGADQATLGAWQAATGKDVSSINGDPLYVTNTDLRIQQGSPSFHAGTPIAGITVDYLGVPRDVATPTIGAYEEVVDVTPPAITYTSPDSGATGVLVNAPIVIGFSEPIEQGTVFYFSSPPLTATHVWNAGGDTMTVTITDFAPATSYLFQVTVANDLNGNPLAPGAVPNPFTFTTTADGTPPTASVVSPAWGATDVALNTPVIVAFSEPMNTGSIIGYATPTDPYSLSWNAAGDTMTATPTTPYDYNSLYNVIATAGTDLAGYNLVPLPDTLAQFTTITNQGPQITMVLQPGDTYDGTGPFLVQAVVSDLVKAKKMAKVNKTAKRGKMGVDFAELYYTTGTSWSNVSGSLGDADTFDFEIPGGFSAGQVVNYYIYAEDDQGDGNYSPATAPVGTYQLKILDPLPPSDLTANAGDMLVQLDWAPPAEVLTYDQNTVVYWWPGADAGIIFSTRFTPQHYPCKLEQAISLWTNNIGMDSLLVHIYADDGTGMPDEGNQLVTPFKVMPLSDVPMVVDLSGYDLVLASGDFHIGYEILTTGMPVPYFDNYLPPDRSLYKDVDDLWYAIGVNNLHQAAVTYSNYSKGLALKSARLNKGQKPNYVLHNAQAPKLAAVNTKIAPQYPKLTGALALAKNISGYEVFRGDVPGGPYGTSLGTLPGLTLLDMTVTNGTPYYYVVRANYSTPDTFSAFSNETTATPAALPILLVNDAANSTDDAEAIYTATMDGAGYPGQYTVYQVGVGDNGPAAPWFTGRSHVIWWTGDDYETTLSPTDEANLAAYLNGGGKLFLSAEDYLYDAYYGLGYFTPGQFPYDYLGVDSVDQDFAEITDFSIAGVAGNFSDGQTFVVEDGSPQDNYPDNLIKRSVAGTYDIFDVTAKVGEKPGVAYDNGTFRTVFFAFPFENIQDATLPSTKAELMGRILSWLNTGVEGKPTAELAKPTVFSLAGNCPNPVRTNTSIKLGLPKGCDVRVELYNIVGQRVKTLVNGKLEAGYHQVNWNGRNESGQKVAAGVYLVRMVTPDYQATRKMTVIR